MNEHQEFEKSWWGTCTNTIDEEQKQFVYMEKMMLQFNFKKGAGPFIDMRGATVLDIGGGPVSLLLKSARFKAGWVLDPCKYPDWVSSRYSAANVTQIILPAEKLDRSLLGLQEDESVDLVLIYNVLQHVEDPEEIIKRARKYSKEIRIFEWIDMEPTLGHPHKLTKKKLDKWLGGNGKTERLNERGCHGMAYYGIFKGDNYIKPVLQ